MINKTQVEIKQILFKNFSTNGSSYGEADPQDRLF